MVSFHGHDREQPRITANESTGDWTILLEDGSVHAWLASTVTLELEGCR